MLFKPYHVPLIQSGVKTQTRRLWDRWHVKVGGTYPVHTRLFAKNVDAEAWIRVDRRWPEPLGDISLQDARAEGYADEAEFFDAWRRINDDFDPTVVVKCVEFRRVEGPDV